MTTTPPATPSHLLQQLSDHTLTALDRKLIDAYERLISGRSDTTDGSLTIANLCTEAGVSRASYYRSPVASAVKELVISGRAPQPEIDKLRAEVRDLRAADRRLRQEHAEQVRQLNATMATYANQIQILTLRNAQLEADNQRLQARMEQADPMVTSLPTRSAATRSSP